MTSTIPLEVAYLPRGCTDRNKILFDRHDVPRQNEHDARRWAIEYYLTRRRQVVAITIIREHA